MHFCLWCQDERGIPYTYTPPPKLALMKYWGLASVQVPPKRGNLQKQKRGCEGAHFRPGARGRGRQPGPGGTAGGAQRAGRRVWRGGEARARRRATGTPSCATDTRGCPWPPSNTATSPSSPGSGRRWWWWAGRQRACPGRAPLLPPPPGI